MSQQSKKADLNKAVTLYTKRLLHDLTEGNPIEQEEIDALNEMRASAGMKPLAIQVTTQGKTPTPKSAPQPERKQPQSDKKPFGGGKQYTRQQDADADPENVAMVPISVGGNRAEAHLMPDNAQWTNRFMIRSESSNKLYTIAQNINKRYWGCNCPGWIGHRKCKHLKALGLPFHEQPYEAKLDKGASVKSTAAVKFGDDSYPELAHILAAELIHSDNELSKLMEVVPEFQGEVHIEGPEAGPSNDELHENTHEESGVPVTDGGLKSPERQNVNAIREALETQVEMEVGKPIEQKEQEVAMQEKVQDAALSQGANSLTGAPAATQEVTAKPGTQIIINVGSKKAAFSADWCDNCIFQHHPDILASSAPGHETTGNCEKCGAENVFVRPVKKPVPFQAAAKQAENEGGAWSISGVTPNTEKNEDVNKALKRMMAAYVGFDDLTSAGRAVMQRIKSKPELVFKYGYEQVLEAVYEATSSLTNLEEIGSSDVSIWLHNVEENLAKYGKTGAEPIGGENQPGATAGHAGGMFGGSDLEGPSFHVGFDFRGFRREASFTSLSEAHKFTKQASAKFGKMAGNWTMKCPKCQGQASKNSPEDNYICPGCGWNSHTAVSEQPTSPKQASVKTAKNVKQVEPDPQFVEAMVRAVLIDHGARAMEMDIPLMRLVSIIKTKIKKVVRKGVATISVYVPENDTEYVMQLPADQAEHGNYKFNPGRDDETGLPKQGAADPAQRNLVLELLKGGRRLSTGEIEKSLGGGKYTNKAWAVLQELAHEGLVSHKQMRWGLKSAERTIMPQETTKQTPGAYGYDATMKTQPIAEDPHAKGAPSWVTSSKKYRIKSAAPLPSTFSIQTRLSEGHPLAGDGGIKTIADKLSQIFADLKRIDPQGFMDSFELQMPSRMMDIAKQHGVQVEHNPSDNTFTFYDQAGASTKGQKHEELQQASTEKEAGPTKAKRLLQQAARLVHQMKMQNAGGLIDMNEMEGLCAEHATPEAVAKLMVEGKNPQIMFLEQKDADHAMCVACGEALAEYSGGEDDWTQNYDVERDHKSYTGSLKTATIHISDGSKKAGDGMAKTVEQEKEAGFNFFFPGQVLKEFYPEMQHEIVDYPNANNQPMGLESPEIVGDGGHELEGVLDEALNPSVIEMIQLPADISDVEPLAMAAADYSSTSPAGGLGIGRDGKPEVLEGAPLRKENDIRGYMFTDEFYGQYEGIPGAAMNVASKRAAEGDEQRQFSLFLKKVCGEIAATMVAAFKVTSRPLLDKVPGIGELQLDVIEQGAGTTMPAGQTSQGGRVKYLMGKLNDGDIKQAINDAWAQAAVWNDNSEGGFVYEVFVRPETIDTDSLVMKYKFIAGTRE